MEKLRQEILQNHTVQDLEDDTVLAGIQFSLELLDSKKMTDLILNTSIRELEYKKLPKC